MYFNRTVSASVSWWVALYYSAIVNHHNEVSFQELLHCFDNDLEDGACNVEHNVEQ